MFVHFKQRRMYTRDYKECTKGTNYIHRALHRTLHIVIRRAVLLFLIYFE
jgi:hypothetical protein